MSLKIWFIVIFVLTAAIADDNNILDEFFSARPGRVRRTPAAERNVLRNLEKVREHNERFQRGEEEFTQSLNDLSVLSEAEIARTRLGFRPPPKEVLPNTFFEPQIVNNASLLAYWNWAEFDAVVHPVQDQGACGSCYAFAAAGAIEGAACLTHGRCAKLSEQEMMDCTNGCDGGWDHWVYNYTRVHAGATLNSFYAYRGFARACNTVTRARQPRTIAGSYRVLPNDEFTIRWHLRHHGPLFVAFYVHSNFYAYASGIIASESGNVMGGHAVVLTGYGTSESGTPYWILKNSWGANWGERGYFRMKRGVNLMNIENWKVSYPLVV